MMDQWSDRHGDGLRQPNVRPSSSTLVLLLSSTDHWDLWHTKRLVDRAPTCVWCQRLARAGFPVETTPNRNRLAAIID